ncbi:DUF2750 domain-containing protein [Archangium violaceum]|uniref:DUF2750 domain-containing protein n=1 Tax=Archangium violaceum Cb vi76 TaxID=1406225 RepID=A0A084SYB5_9BACT|nr:DUF2750 domain-containing protein [Archangium violaceum]KFA93450.1 hypothetical protein Q664_09080 [Archangium violaceum Cb vi76]
MESEQSQDRMQAVLRLPAARRYAYFLQRVAESGEVWGLDGEGWALALDDTGRDVLPLWPAPEFAAMCATRLWSGFQPRAIKLHELLENVLPQLEEEGMPVGIFFTPEGQGHPVSARELIDALSTPTGSLA